MNSGFVAAEVRRGTRNLLIANVLLLASLLFWAACSVQYFHNFFGGPFPLGSERFTANGYPTTDHEFFSVDTDTLTDSGIYSDVTDNGTTTRYLYLYGSVETNAGFRPIFVKLSSSHDRVVTGFLGPIPAQLLKRSDLGPFPDGLMPLQIVVGDYRTDGYVGLSIGALLGVLVIWNIQKAACRFVDPQCHPLYKSLREMGDAATLERDIDEQMTLAPKRIGPLAFTDSWILRRHWWGLQAIHLPGCLWVFKRVSRRYVNGIPTAERSYATVIRDRHGQSCEVRMKEHRVDEAIREVAVRAPWSLFGFDKEIDSLWWKDRRKLVSIVESRLESARFSKAA